MKELEVQQLPPEEDPDVKEGAVRSDHTHRSRVPEYFHGFSMDLESKERKTCLGAIVPSTVGQQPKTVATITLWKRYRCT